MDSSDNIKYVTSFYGMYYYNSMSIDEMEGKIGTLIQKSPIDLNIFNASDGSFMKRYVRGHSRSEILVSPASTGTNLLLITLGSFCDSNLQG